MVPFLALLITLTAYCLPADSYLVRVPRRAASASGGPLESLRCDLIPGDALSIVCAGVEAPSGSAANRNHLLRPAAILWLSSSLFVSIMDAMNRIMGVEETRPLWKQRGIAVLMTFSQAAILIVVFATIIIWPQILGWLGLSRAAAVLATALHAVAVFVMILLSFAVAMYFGPDADQRGSGSPPGACWGPSSWSASAISSASTCSTGQPKRDLRITGRHCGAHELAVAVQHRAARRRGIEQGHRGCLAPGETLRGKHEPSAARPWSGVWPRIR